MNNSANDNQSEKRMPVAVPIILSGFICPGLGQFVQRRHTAGAVYFALSAAALAWFLLETLPVIRTVYALAYADMADTTAEDPQYSIPRMVASFITIGVVWLVNLFDVFYAVIRRRTTEPEPPFPPPPPENQ